MKRKYLIPLLTLSIGVIAGLSFDQNLMAGKKPFTRTVLLQQDLNDMSGKEVIISYVEIAPNAKIPKHYHPAHVFGYVLEGSGTIEYEDGTTENLKVGHAFYEIPNRNITGRNTSTTKPNKAIVFIIKDKGKPAAVNVKKK
jgi:quercetin dioxygenase-like cupin family protein